MIHANVRGGHGVDPYSAMMFPSLQQRLWLAESKFCYLEH